MFADGVTLSTQVAHTQAPSNALTSSILLYLTVMPVTSTTVPFSRVCSVLESAVAVKTLAKAILVDQSKRLIFEKLLTKFKKLIRATNLLVQFHGDMAVPRPLIQVSTQTLLNSENGSTAKCKS